MYLKNMRQNFWALAANLSSAAKKNSKKMEKNFVSKKNFETGKPEWVLVGEDYDYFQEIGRSAYADMLHDADRNERYYEGIKWAVNKLHDEGKRAVVLDIGTGTGLLSMMAARAGAEEIFACEAFTPMLNCARKVIKRNGLSKKIKLIAKRSTDLKIGQDLPKKCNLLVTELFDTELIGEGALGSYNHAIQELCEPDVLAIPASATVYMQLVSSDAIKKFNVLEDLTLNEIKVKFPLEISDCAGAASVHDLQLSEFTDFEPLGDPIPVFTFHWNKGNNLRDTSAIPLPSARPKSPSVFLYWSLNMDGTNGNILDCSPRFINPSAAWRDHWMQAAYYIPERLIKTSSLQVHHTEFSYNFDAEAEGFCTCGVHNHVSRSRIANLNDVERAEKFLRAVGKSGKNEVHVYGENSILPFFLGKMGKNVVIFGENVFYEKMRRSDGGFERVRFGAGAGACAQAIEICDDLELVRSSADQRAVLKVVAVEFNDLWKIKARVGETCGFDLADFDDLIMTSLDSLEEPDSFALWEYPHELTSEIYSHEIPPNAASPYEIKGKFPLEKPANALVFWIDWKFTKTGEEINSFENGKWKKSAGFQRVLFCRGAEGFASYRVTCDNGVIALFQ